MASMGGKEGYLLIKVCVVGIEVCHVSIQANCAHCWVLIDKFGGRIGAGFYGVS